MNNISNKDLQQIKTILKEELNIDECAEINRLGGLTNRTYSVDSSLGRYVVRIPGEGTEDIISRENEKISSKLASKLDIDIETIVFKDNGIKISKYIPNAITMTPSLISEDCNLEKAAHLLKKLHNCGEDTKVPFNVMDMAESYENYSIQNNVELFDDYEIVKKEVIKIKDAISEENNIQNVPCHNDTLCENWILGNDRLYLIDWEYAGMNDYMWDLADLSIEACFNEKTEKSLLKFYFGRDTSTKENKRFLANKIFLDFLWSLWGKTRVPIEGVKMEVYANDRYKRMKDNIDIYKSMYDL